ncbi:MAG TPA: hypothetical protein ENF75_02650, partial [Acidilobales archaeon]|nr:hypothetical protein [Acidilobales archaeon]
MKNYVMVTCKFPPRLYRLLREMAEEESRRTKQKVYLSEIIRKAVKLYAIQNHLSLAIKYLV